MKDYTQYMKNLPVMPDIATKILSIAEEKLDISFKELENTIKMDPGLSAKILRVANSALYARQREIKNLQMAITLLGFKTIKSLVMLITASNMFTKGKNAAFYKFYWKHSVIVAFLAKDMAEKTMNRNLADVCFLSGLLHNIGQTALHNADPEGYDKVLELARSGEKRISEIELELYDVSHREVGADVLRNWHFPDVYVDTAAEHGSANVTSSHKTAILLVSAADFVASNIDLYKNNPLEPSVIRDILRQTSLKESDISEYQTSFINSLGKDQLFQECKTLFQIS
ncbi:MAG: HDOD domain-containing protein [Spirochaetales bacterium]|jgi:putative nucleotidyltransferase with HDIG domain|nr:HDOD domain-containing protein [Spirochaetales bacterium]